MSVAVRPAKEYEFNAPIDCGTNAARNRLFVKLSLMEDELFDISDTAQTGTVLVVRSEILAEDSIEVLAEAVVEMMNETPEAASPQAFQFTFYIDDAKVTTDDRGGGYVLCQRGIGYEVFDTLRLMHDKIDSLVDKH